MAIVVLVIVAAIIIAVVIIIIVVIIIVVILIVANNGRVDGRMDMDGGLNGWTDCVRRLCRFSLSSWEHKTVDVVSAKSRRAVVDSYMPSRVDGDASLEPRYPPVETQDGL